MKSQQLSLFVLVASVSVFLSTAAPMDTPSGSQSSPRLPTETEDQVQPTPTGFFRSFPKKIHEAIANHLNIKDSANLASASKHYRNGIKGSDQSPAAYFGSEENYVKDVYYCKWLQHNPEQKKAIRNIYVTSKVFMACQFNPTDFPKLRNVNIKLDHVLEFFGDFVPYENLLKVPGLIAMKGAAWTPEDPLKLNIFVSERNLVPLELYLIQEKRIDWLEFLLNHRDWNSFKNAFKAWDSLVFAAMNLNNVEFLPLLYRIAETHSIRQGRDPFALDWLIIKSDKHDDLFRGHVDEGFMNALIAVRSRNVDAVEDWLKRDPTPEQISRVFAVVLRNFKNLGSFADEIEKSFINDPRFDVNYKDMNGQPLIFTAIYHKNWNAFDSLMSKEGIEVNAVDGDLSGILAMALQSKISVERFQQLLEKGADTFVPGMLYGTPLLLAASKTEVAFAKAIIEKRKVEYARGVVKIQLTAEEKEKMDQDQKFKELVGHYPIQIVQPK